MCVVVGIFDVKHQERMKLEVYEIECNVKNLSNHKT